MKQIAIFQPYPAPPFTHSLARRMHNEKSQLIKLESYIYKTYILVVCVVENRSEMPNAPVKCY